MKTIGMLGGMSWESTQSYYQAINEGIKAQLGGLNSAKYVYIALTLIPLKNYSISETGLKLLIF